MKQTETDLKHQLKDYLALKGIFSWPVTQGIASYKGAPDRVMHLNGKVVYLEIKLPKGKMSENQLDFQAQCEDDNISYVVIRSLEDLQVLVEPKEQAQGCVVGGCKCQSSGKIPTKKKAIARKTTARKAKRDKGG